MYSGSEEGVWVQVLTFSCASCMAMGGRHWSLHSFTFILHLDLCNHSQGEVEGLQTPGKRSGLLKVMKLIRI